MVCDSKKNCSRYSALVCSCLQNIRLLWLGKPCAGSGELQILQSRRLSSSSMLRLLNVACLCSKLRRFPEVSHGGFAPSCPQRLLGLPLFLQWAHVIHLSFVFLLTVMLMFQTSPLEFGLPSQLYLGSVVARPVRVLLPQRKQLRRRLLFRSLDSLDWIDV